MNMKTKFLFSSVAIFIGIIVNAQDVHFSQLTETPLLLNPAETALGHDVMGIINYKDQWKSVGTHFRTFNVSADVGVFRKKNGNRLGLGLDVFSDKAGEGNMATTSGTFHLSGVLAANDNNLFSAGLSAGFGQRSLVYDKLSWDNQYDGLHYDATLPTGEPATFANHNYVDFSAGIAWFYGTGHSTLSSNDAHIFNAGVAVQHINKPVYSFYGDNNERLPMRFVFHGMGDIGIKNYSLILEPAYIVMLQAGHHEINAGMMVKYTPQEASRYTGRKKASAFCLGGYYRFSDAVVVATRYEFSNWAVGLSYDVNVSGLKDASHAKGGFEIALRYMAPNPFGGGQSSRLFD